MEDERKLISSGPAEQRSLSRRGVLGAISTAGVATGAFMTSSASAASPASRRRFEGRVAVVTGAARGMGRSHAIALAREGARVVGCDILEDIASLDYPLATQADMDETGRLVKAAGGEFLGRKADVRVAAEASAVIAAALETYGRVDLLAANAGIFSTAPLATMTDQLFDDVIRTNLFGVFHIMRAAIGPMQRQNYGRIVATSSAAGRMGIPTGSHYAASKWGVIGMAKSLALEVAKQGITVNCVCPTGVNTPLVNNPAAWRRALPGDPSPTREKFEAKQRANPFTPQGVPWVEAQDVTEAVLFLLSDEARHITGSAIDVSAGGGAMNMA